MRKLLTVLVCLAAGQASAADLAVKAKPIAYPYGGSGCYFGVNAEAGVAKSNESGNALFVSSLASGDMIAAGGSVGGSVGCLYGNNQNWIAVQGNLNYQNITGSIVAPGGSLGISSKWQASQVVKFGGFPALLSWLPNLGLNFPVLAPPPVAPVGLNIVTLVSQPYVMAGIQEFDNSGWFQANSGRSIGVAPLLGAGVINQLADSSGKPNGAVLDTYAKVVFPGRGFSIDNIGGNPGFSAAANMGTQYYAGVAIYY